jgi:hypothetical protein
MFACKYVRVRVRVRACVYRRARPAMRAPAPRPAALHCTALHCTALHWVRRAVYHTGDHIAVFPEQDETTVRAPFFAHSVTC